MPSTISAPAGLEQLLSDFLSAENDRLAPSTLARYRQVITLFRIFLENAEGEVPNDPGVLLEKTHDFLHQFLPVKLHASPRTVRHAATVMRKLLGWVEDKGYGRLEGVAEVSDAVNLHRALSQHVGTQTRTHAARQTKDHFNVVRVEPGEMWLEPMSQSGSVIGPVTVPRDVSRLCRVGWDIGGVVAKSFGGWKWVEVWSVST